MYNCKSPLFNKVRVLTLTLFNHGLVKICSKYLQIRVLFQKLNRVASTAEGAVGHLELLFCILIVGDKFLDHIVYLPIHYGVVCGVTHLQELRVVAHKKDKINSKIA